MLIKKPVLRETEHVSGKIKFFNKDKGFGFVEYDSKDYFFHRSWLMEPVFRSEMNVHCLGFEPGGWEPKTGQGVLFHPVHNEERDALEAHDIIDAIKGHYVLRDVEAGYRVACQLHSTLVDYRVTVVIPVNEWVADNIAKQFVPKKVSETRTTVFQGNDIQVLRRVLLSGAVVGAMFQPGATITFERMNDGEYSPCGNPVQSEEAHRS